MATARASRGLIRVLGGLTAALGTGLLLQPHRLARRICGSQDVPNDVVLRVLGAREVVQGVAQIAYPKKDLVVSCIAVDALHVLSMLVLAAVWPSYRRAALASATMAGISVGAGAALLMSEHSSTQA